MKCIECQEPMTPTNKGKPEGLPDNVEWIACRQCEKGVEVVKTSTDPDENATPAKALEYEEVIKTWVVIKKNSKGVTKSIYTDKSKKELIREEKIG